MGSKDDFDSENLRLLAAVLDRPESELDEWGWRNSFRSEIGLDSIELFEIVVRIEERVGRPFPTEFIDSLDCLADVLHALTLSP